MTLDFWEEKTRKTRLSYCSQLYSSKNFIKKKQIILLFIFIILCFKLIGYFLKTYCNYEKIFKQLLSDLVLIAGFIGLSTSQAHSEDINDPFENTNRRIFDFNNTLDDNFSNLLPRFGVKFLISLENHYQI